ncbi:hypothetical protein QLX67_06000 [Balneolaceae bacterium ANBcel3]|nr:hypothetical protein [Balneolaceae bacterium ANBcel3]
MWTVVYISFICFFSVNAFAGSANPDTTAVQSETISAEHSDSLSIESNDIDTTEVYLPMRTQFPVVYTEISSDSLARWELWTDPGERLARRYGIIASRLGAQGRNDGFILDGYEPGEQRIFLDGIPFNERIFGSANRNRLPHYSRIASVHHKSGGINHLESYTRNRYHVSRPLTFINYEQTTYEYRNTEGFLSQNISPRMNVSLAYQGRNENEGYTNRAMGGRNAEASVYYYLSHRWLLETGADYSGLQLDEPGGYPTADMNHFSFDRFAAQPADPQAASSVSNARFYVTLHGRAEAEDQSNVRLSAYYDCYRRFFYGQVDSSSVRTHTAGLTAEVVQPWKIMEWSARFRSEWSIIGQDKFQSMMVDSWGYHELEVIHAVTPGRLLWSVRGRGGYRTDAFTELEAGSSFRLDVFPGAQLTVSASAGERMPLPGHLYWDGVQISGNETLNNEFVMRAEASLHYQSSTWDLGVKTFLSSRKDPVLLSEDGLFLQEGEILSMGASAWIALDRNRFEASLSGTFQEYHSDDPAITHRMLDRSGQRAWARASFYYKNEVFNRAAFLKTGFYLQVSPSVYRAMQYYDTVDYWDPNSWHYHADITEAQALPEFARLDLDLSARVRSVFVLLRLENALDDWVTSGYFETPWQPMPSRRMRFGIRWVLRN